MASKKPAVEIPVKLKKDQAEKDVKQLSKSMFKSFADIKAGFDLAAKGLGLLGSALGGVINASKEAVKLAGIQERAERDLTKAIRQRQKFTDSEFVSLKRFNSEVQQATTIGDDQLLQLQKQLTLQGVEKEQLKDVTKAVIGLSEVKGTGLAESASVVTRVLRGEIGALKESGIVVNSVKEGMGALIKNYDLAADRSQTLSGQIDLLKGNVGDLKETFGMTVAKSDRVVTAFEAINGAVLKFNDFFAGQKGAKLIDVWFKRLLFFGSKAIEMFSAIEGSLERAYQNSQGGVRGRARSFSAAVRGGGGSIAAQREREMNKWRGQFTDKQAQAGGFKDANAWARSQAFERFPETAAEIAQALADELLKAASKPFVAGGRAIGGGTGGGGGGGGGGDETQKKKKILETQKALAAIQNAWDERSKVRNERKRELERLELSLEVSQNEARFQAEVAAFDKRQALKDEELARTQQFYNQLSSIALSGLGNMISGLVAAGLSGEKSLSEVMGSMFGAMLSQVGSMLMSLGTATVLAAAAAKPVPLLWGVLPPGLAAAAGLGLIAAGGTLMGVGQYVSSSGSATKAELSRVQGSARRMTPSAADNGRPGQVTEETSTVYNINFNGALPGSERRIAKEIRRIMTGGFSPAGAV